MSRRVFRRVLLSEIAVSFIIWMILMLAAPGVAHPRNVGFSPVRITEVEMSPDPFIIGKSALTMAVLVELPPSLHGANVLEVSVMITSPTRRSMSFVAQRRMVDNLEVKGKKTTIPMVLVWDGKDQYHQFVPDGSYYYEFQAKLMEDQGHGPRTKVVSQRVRGILQALAYPSEVLPPLLPKPEIPEDLIIPGDDPEGDGPITDEEGGGSDDPEVSGEENSVNEAEDRYPEKADGSRPDSHTGEREEIGDRVIVETPEGQTSELFIESMPVLPRPGEEIPPGH
jgi:hypothetical protein